MPAYRPPVNRDLQWDEVRNVHRYADFPSDTDGRMNAITSSLNNGMKALMWSVGLSRSYRTSEQIRDYVRDAVGEGYVVRPFCFSSYAEKTMGPVGAIVRAQVRMGDGRWKNGFGLTEEGEKFRPVVDYTIKYFVDNNLDFNNVFGLAKEGGPKNRIGLVKALAEKGEARIVDLVDILKIGHPVVVGHLNALREEGFLEYESVTSQNGRMGLAYSLIRTPEEIKKCGRFEIERIRKALETLQVKEGGFTHMDFSEVSGYSEHSSATVISDLHEGGSITPMKFAGRDLRSSIRLLEKGRKFYDDWYLPFERALETEDFSTVQTKSDREHYAAVALSFAESSPIVQKQTREERLGKIVSVVEANPGITARELCEKAGIKKKNLNVITNLAKERGMIVSVPSNTSEGVECFYHVGI